MDPVRHSSRTSFILEFEDLNTTGSKICCILDIVYMLILEGNLDTANSKICCILCKKISSSQFLILSLMFVNKKISQLIYVSLQNSLATGIVGSDGSRISQMGGGRQPLRLDRKPIINLPRFLPKTPQK